MEKANGVKRTNGGEPEHGGFFWHTNGKFNPTPNQKHEITVTDTPKPTQTFLTSCSFAIIYEGGSFGHLPVLQFVFNLVTMKYEGKS